MFVDGASAPSSGLGRSCPICSASLGVAERVGGTQPEGKGEAAKTMKYTFQRISVDAPPAQSGSGSSQR